MDAILRRNIQNLAMDQLRKQWGDEEFDYLLDAFRKLRKSASCLWEKRDEMDVTAVKAATITTFSILKKIAEGKATAEFDQQDWAEIADSVAQYAIIPNGQAYSVYVFKLYERYIRGSVIQIQGIVSPSTFAAINRLADELSVNGDKLEQGEISEVQYTEECLWISLEAMVKLLACVSYLCGKNEIAEFTQALAVCAFEYGRLMLYRKEQKLVTRLLESQYIMDDQLNQAYGDFKNQLLKETEEFYSFIDQAFNPDFRTAFLQSILLAKTAGVPEEEILSSTDDIDQFFL